MDVKQKPISCLSQAPEWTEPAAQACVQTQTRTGNLLICGSKPNPLSQTCQGLKLTFCFIFTESLWKELDIQCKYPSITYIVMNLKGGLSFHCPNHSVQCAGDSDSEADQAPSDLATCTSVELVSLSSFPRHCDTQSVCVSPELQELAGGLAVILGA